MERKTFRLKLSDLDDQGIFTGYAAIFDVEDLQGDIIERGAFKRTLDHSGGSVPILWQHRSEEPIGVGLEAKEDSNGLYVKGHINLDVQRGKEAHSLLKQGAIKGLSIGYDPIKKDYKDGVRHLKEIKIYEYSPVTFPAQPLANVLDVKEKSLIFSESYDIISRYWEVEQAVCNANQALSQTIWEIIYSDNELDTRLSLASTALDEFKQAYLTWIQEFSDFYGLKSIQPINFKAGRMLSSANLTQIKDVITLLSALVEKAEPSEDPDEVHSEDEKQSNDSADTKSDSTPSLDDELQTLLSDMKSYIKR